MKKCGSKKQTLQQTEGNIQKHLVQKISIIKTKETYQNQEQIKSQFFKEYHEFFSHIKSQSIDKFQQNLRLHNISYSENFNFKKQSLRQEYISEIQNLNGYKINNLNIVIGGFSVNLQICNMNFKKQFDHILQNDRFQGSFGNVYIWHYKNQKYATKNFHFQSIHNQSYNSIVTNTLFQYSYNKLFSALQIGPKSCKPRGFDIIIYKNCIEFDMEHCENISLLKSPIHDQISYFKSKQTQLYQSLKFMHSLHIIHHDIKPANIMFSQCFDKFVFIDFGFTKITKVPLGQKQKTLFIGTYNFVTEQMKNTVTKQTSFVDLYWNDLYGLKLSLDNILNEYQKFNNLQHLFSNSQSLDSFIGDQNTQERLEFYKIIEILRKKDENCNIQKLINQVGKQKIKNNYLFFLDFFLTFAPTKQIGFFCQRFLKNMIQNNIFYKQKINLLFQKGWPKTLYVPQWNLNPQYQVRLNFYLKKKQFNFNFNFEREAKIFKKNIDLLKFQLLQASRHFQHFDVKAKFEFLKILLAYGKKQDNLSQCQNTGRKIFLSCNFKKVTNLKISTLVQCILNTFKRIQIQFNKDNAGFFKLIPQKDYHQIIFNMCELLVNTEYYTICEAQMNYLLKNQKNEENLRKVYCLTVDLFQKMYLIQKSNIILYKWAQINEKYSQVQLQHNFLNRQEEINQKFQQKQSFSNHIQRQEYWKIRYKKSLASQYVYTNQLNQALKLVEQCLQKINIFTSKKSCFNKLFGSLFLLKACIKLNQNLVEESLKLVFQSNRYYSCIKKDNRLLAVYISNIYCILEDVKQARKYLNVANAMDSFEKDPKMYILQGQIFLLQCNVKKAEQYFDTVIQITKKQKSLMLKKLYSTFASQFKGIQSHLFLLKYLKDSQNLINQNQEQQNILENIQQKLNMLETKMKFYIFLKFKCSQGSQKLLIQIEKSLQSMRKHLKNIKQLSLFGVLIQRFVYFEALVLVERQKYEQSNILLKQIMQNRQQNYAFLSPKQIIECESLFIENCLKLKIVYSDLIIRKEMQNGVSFHSKFDCLIYCLNSNVYSLNILKYAIETNQQQKMIEMILNISLHVTNYQSQRYRDIFNRICSGIVNHKLFTLKTTNLINIFYQQKNLKILSQGSQIILFLYQLYLNASLNERRKIIRTVLKNITYLKPVSRQKLLNNHYIQFIKDLKQQGMLKQKKIKFIDEITLHSYF